MFGLVQFVHMLVGCLILMAHFVLWKKIVICLRIIKHLFDYSYFVLCFLKEVFQIKDIEID